MDTISAIGIKQGKIVQIGAAEDFKDEGALKWVDLKGRHVLPGFVDTHLHALDCALMDETVDLTQCRSIEEVLEAVRSHVESLAEPPAYIIGKGWNQDLFGDEKSSLTRADLDKVSAEIPLFLTRVCCHMAVVNTKALEFLLSLENLKERRSMIDERDGILRESAALLASELYSELTEREILSRLQAFQEKLNRAGITSVHSTDFTALPANAWEKVVNAYRSGEAEGSLTVRTCEQAFFTQIEHYRDFLDRSVHKEKTGDYFKIGPLKLFIDGSLGARTALLKEPYSDAPEVSGIQAMPDEILREYMDLALAEDMALAVHAIGDLAAEKVISLIAEASEKHGKNNLRHGIVHAQITNIEILEKMLEKNIMAYIQPVFVATDRNVAEIRLGHDRARVSYAWKSMHKMGIRLSGGSDSPVERFDILENIYHAVTRQDKASMPCGGWNPHEKLSVEQAVRLFTTGGAYASGDEDVSGTLEAGKWADFVVMDENVFEVGHERIRDIQILATAVGGSLVYEALS